MSSVISNDHQWRGTHFSSSVLFTSKLIDGSPSFLLLLSLLLLIILCSFLYSLLLLIFSILSCFFKKQERILSLLFLTFSAASHNTLLIKYTLLLLIFSILSCFLLSLLLLIILYCFLYSLLCILKNFLKREYCTLFYHSLINCITFFLQLFKKTSIQVYK